MINFTSYPWGKSGEKGGAFLKIFAETNRIIGTGKCFGIAISKAGAFPCPILVDVPEARISADLADVIGTTHALPYEYCDSCFATGTSCGQ